MRRNLVICLFACSLWLLVSCGEQKNTPAPAAPPPPDVSVVETKAQDVPIYLEFVGETHGLKDIAIRARIEGFLNGIFFQEGREVKKGSLLYSLENQTYEEKVAARMSNVAEAQTMLAKARGT